VIFFKQLAKKKTIFGDFLKEALQITKNLPGVSSISR
jgi:hypothetical protein